jgi:hypothetical protein
MQFSHLVRAMQVREVGSGAAQREAREKLLDAARRREIDIVVVWRLDRWGRSVTDLLATLQELEHLGVGFVSLTEALDLTTPSGRAMAGLLAVFAEFEREILRERVRAGLADAKRNGQRLGRPMTAGLQDAPASPGGILPHVSVLHRESVLIVGRDTGVKSGAEHSRRFPCLAENPTRFCLFRCRIDGHFAVSLLHGRIESFPARQDSSYYAAAGVASRASVSR